MRPPRHSAVAGLTESEELPDGLVSRRFVGVVGRMLLVRLLKATGRFYAPASDLPNGLIAATAKERASWLVRGLFKLRRPVFIGARVRIRGKAGLEIGKYATLEPYVTLDGYSQEGISIGRRTKIGAYSVISCTSHLSLLGKGFKIGSDSGIGEFCYVGASGGVVIGDSVIMGQFVTFHAQEHEYSDPDVLIRDQGVTQRGIAVGDDCWVGARVTFLDGANVGRGCVVAAGAVVRGTIPPYSVIAGVPAKVVGRRGEETADGVDSEK